MDDFDQRHYFAPRVDRTPGILHSPAPRRDALQWGAIAALITFVIAMLLWTDCGGPQCW